MGRYRKYGFAAAAPPFKTEASTVQETVQEPGASGETDVSGDTVRISLNQENTEEERETDPARSREEELLESMSLREKAAQMFVVLPEGLLSASESEQTEGKEELLDNGAVIRAGEPMENAYEEIPVGGFIYMKSNLKDPEQTKALLSGLSSYSEKRFGIPSFQCADVLTNPANQVVKRRSFGSDPKLVSDMALAVEQGLGESGVYGVFKHFPGHGATEGDTHEGYAYTSKSLNELWDCELLPFRRASENGADFIMAGHIALPNVAGDNTPASLSEKLLTGLLRETIGYDGIIVTDAMNMGAIVSRYSSAEAAVQAVIAGADIILMPEDLRSAWEGLVEAVESGEISEERIDASVRRILEVKLRQE